MGKAQLASNRWLILCQTKRVAHARNLAHLFSFLVWLLICETIWFRFLHFYNYSFYKRWALNSFWMQKRITIAKTSTTVPLNKSPLHFNWRGLWHLSQNDVKAKKRRQYCQGKYITVTQQVFLSWNRIHIAFCSYNLPPLSEHLPHAFLGSFSVFCSEVTFRQFQCLLLSFWGNFWFA